MGRNFFNISFRGKKVFLAPLDWGLGHTTRCIPLIKALLEAGNEVTVGGNHEQAVLISAEFPRMGILLLPGYNVKYGPKALKWSIVSQYPKIRSAIRNENEWLKKFISKNHIDVVVSDNRFGLWNKNVYSVFITHQLRIKSPFGAWSEDFLQDWNYDHINNFNECWVPDFEGKLNLAGELSHPKKLPTTPVKYIGPLSRFNDTNHGIGDAVTKDHILFILSGPEPQRTIFEKMIFKQLDSYPGKATIVRGLPGSEQIIPDTGRLKFYNHLPAKQLLEEIEKASMVIARCGYSTVMDMVALGKKSILIPTPGQTEQEYLASHLMSQEIAYCIPQNNFLLEKALQAAGSFGFRTFATTND